MLSEQYGSGTCPNLSVSQLERECDVFSRYLLGTRPTSYVVEHYVDFHVRRGIPRSRVAHQFDTLLLRVARASPWCARIADSYASMHYKSASLRKKLVLLLGILECVTPTAQQLDETRHRNAVVAATSMSIQFLGYFTHLAIATVVLGPVHLLLRRS